MQLSRNKSQNLKVTAFYLTNQTSLMSGLKRHPAKLVKFRAKKFTLVSIQIAVMCRLKILFPFLAVSSAKILDILVDGRDMATRPPFILPFSRIALVFQAVCCHTMGDRL